MNLPPIVAAQCNMCPWRSVSLPEGTAKKVAVVHVCMEHPQTYLEVTKRDKLPAVSEWERWELDVWTDRESSEVEST